MTSVLSGANYKMGQKKTFLGAELKYEVSKLIKLNMKLFNLYHNAS